MKQYLYSKLFDVTEKTFCDKYKKALSDLVENNGDWAKVSIDGTDCSIYEPTPFDTKWYSHKLNGPGLRYEVGICIVSGHIVWVSGPHECGSYPALKIAREGILNILENGEKLIADRGYKGEEQIWHKGHCAYSAKMEGIVRARHENTNGKLKKNWCHDTKILS